MSTATLISLNSTRRSVANWLPWIALPAVLGSASALACVGVRLFFWFLQWVFTQHMGPLPAAAATLSTGRRIAMPIVGAILATLVTWLAARLTPRLHFEDYVEAVRLRGGRIQFLSTAWRTLSSAFSVASGAAIGREGSMIQFATAVSSWVGARTQMRSYSLSQKVAFGAAAAVAAVYQAPIAGIFFASEIVLGEWRWENTVPLSLASACGWLVSSTILGSGPLFPVAGRVHLTISLLWIVPLSLLAGLLGPAYQKLLHYSRVAKQLPFALLWSAAIVGGLSLLEPRIWGNGDVALTSILHGNLTLAGILMLLGFRLIATTACVGTGTVGGVFTPTLFAGAAFGLASAHMVPCHEPLQFAIYGMALLMAAVTHAPLMAAFMAMELSGQWHLLPILVPGAMLASFVAQRISPMSLYGIASPDPAE
jgi:chloride channel protein, CIC family